jgi:hypothetical protein
VPRDVFRTTLHTTWKALCTRDFRCCARYRHSTRGYWKVSSRRCIRGRVEPRPPPISRLFSNTKRVLHLSGTILSVQTTVLHRLHTATFNMNPSIFDNVLKAAANSKPTQPFKQQPYAFTEITNVNWSKPVNLEDASTAESQLWLRTVQTYENHPGTTNIWFGTRLDSPQITILIVGVYTFSFVLIKSS